MKYRSLYIVLAILSAPPAAADLYRDALSAFNSGHFGVARQLADQLASDHPKKAGMLQSIDAAVASKRLPQQIDLSVDELERQQEGKVFRSLDEPQLMQEVYVELDRSSDRRVIDGMKPPELREPVGELLTVDQQVARLKQKMGSPSPKRGINDALVSGPVGQVTIQAAGNECLSPDQINSYFSKARADAAAFAMDKARAIAKANEVRQQRALARMRLELTADITRKIRRELDSRFDKEVAERVAALEAGQLNQQRPKLADGNPGQPEILPTQQSELRNTMSSGDNREWLEMAADSGNAQTLFEVGQWFFHPEAGEPDYVAAAMWWERARLAGHVDAAAALSILRQRQTLPGLAVNGS